MVRYETILRNLSQVDGEIIISNVLRENEKGYCLQHAKKLQKEREK